MSEQYQCLSCKRTATIEEKQEIPTCCGKPMTIISKDICLQPPHPEHARPMESENACDDFRAGE